MVTDDAAGELYVADGYGNRRIIVFDSKTGAYKRHWGAYGAKQLTDEKLPAYRPVARAVEVFLQPRALRAAVPRRPCLRVRSR